MEKRTFTPEYKAKIVIEILREEENISEIASREKIIRPCPNSNKVKANKTDRVRNYI